MRATRTFLLAVTAILVAGCSRPAAPANPPGPPPVAAAPGGPDNPVLESTRFAPALAIDLKAMTKSASGLYYRDLTVGSGGAAVGGQELSVHYRGVLADGTEFDSGNYTFTVGGRKVIRGWDEGLVGMRVGGKRQLVIPPEMGYGLVGSPPKIPGDAVLVFTVDLLGIK